MRELDAWIAENVFGWKPYQKRNASTWVHPSGHHASYGAWPDYTTDKAAAFEVLEKLCDPLRYSHNILIYRINTDSEKWAVAMDSAYEKENKPTQFAETLPLAICLFARQLFAKEGV